MIKELFIEHSPVAKTFLAALVPGAAGATVAVAVQGAMTWTQRFIQLTVGIAVSYYAGEVAADMFDISEVVRNGIGFTAGIGAFEIVKKLRLSLGEVAHTAPKDLWAFVKSRLGIKEGQ